MSDAPRAHEWMVVPSRSIAMTPRTALAPLVAILVIATLTGDQPTADASPPPGCTDGGTIDGAIIGATGPRYCVDKQCWRFDATSRRLVPIDVASALTRRSDDVATLDLQRRSGHLTPAWTGKDRGDHQIELCGPAGCTRLAIDRLGRTDDDADEVAGIEVSPSGNRVAVVRGAAMQARQRVELFDRASHKHLATITPKEPCADVVAFAGESAVIQEWDCINQGGPRMIVSPHGTVVARIPGSFGHPDRVLHVAGEHYAFENNGEGKVSIYDVLRGDHTTTETSQFTDYLTADATLFAFEPSGRLTILAASGSIVARATPPTCRWAWEAETIGTLHVEMTAPEVERSIGRPRTTTTPDDTGHVTAGHGRGLSLVLQTHPPNAGDPSLTGPEPARVIAIDVVAPSRLATKAGITIGSSVEALDRAYGEWRDPRRSRASVRVFGNPNDTGGWRFDIVDGKVAGIHVADSFE